VHELVKAAQEMVEELPRHLKRYVELRGNPGQLVQLIAVLAGHKPVLDDTVPSENLEPFLELLQSQGLHTVVESQIEFIADPRDADWIVGGAHFNTTRAVAHPPHQPTAGGHAHVLCARDPDVLHEAMAGGWYELAAEGRVVHKPWIDHYRYGHWLGYPVCCRDFFARHNDWNTDNSLFQAFRGTKLVDYRCNTIVKHTGFSYACHLPCTFDCAETAARARKIEARVEEVSPTLRQFVDSVLRRPYLVLSEWEAFGFDGTTEIVDQGEGKTRRVRYTDVFPVPSNRPERHLLELLRQGDVVEVDEDVLRIGRQGQTISTYQTMGDRFGPQIPFIIDFDCAA
jgi:hypothetical protein